jgi:hypothetical protein
MRSDEDDALDPIGNPSLAPIPGAPGRVEEFGSKRKTPLYIEYTVS